MLVPDPRHPLAEDNREIHYRYLDLRPTHEVKQEYESTFDSDTDESRHLRGILEIELTDAEQRDALELGRPIGCWCLGTGGRDPIENGDGTSVWRVRCTCPEGQLL